MPQILRFFRTKIYHMLYKMLLKNLKWRTYGTNQIRFQLTKIHKYLQAHNEAHPAVENVCFY